MTNERQQEIQGSLFKMLGAEDKEVKPQHRGGQLGSASDDVNGDIKEGEEEKMLLIIQSLKKMISSSAHLVE